MAKTKIIGFSMPPEVHEEIVEYASRENKTKSELFREMVVLYREKKKKRSITACLSMDASKHWKQA